MYYLYTDGAASLNNGGLGLVILNEDKLVLQYSRHFNNVTNNQMELLSIIIGFKYIKNKIDLTVISDSKYCIGCAMLNWKRNKNKKLWNEFDRQFNRLIRLGCNIIFKHVKGHNGNYWNEYVDNLAVNSKEQWGQIIM